MFKIASNFWAISGGRWSPAPKSVRPDGKPKSGCATCFEGAHIVQNVDSCIIWKDIVDTEDANKQVAIDQLTRFQRGQESPSKTWQSKVVGNSNIRQYVSDPSKVELPHGK